MSVTTGPWRRAGVLVLAAHFLLSAAGVGVSFAGQVPASDTDINAAPDSWPGPVPGEEPLPWADTSPWGGPVPGEGPPPWAGPVPDEEPLPWAGPVPDEEPLPWEDTVPWPGPVPFEEPLPWKRAVRPGYMAALGRTMDEAHAGMERGILRQVVRLDTFFGTNKSPVLRETSYELRWRSSLRIQHAWELTPGTTVRARVVLSRISDRLHLAITGEDERGQIRPTLPEDPGSPGTDRTTSSAHFANTELRYELIQKPELNLFLGAGVKVSLPFEAFVRSRIQYTHPFGDVYLIRVAETFFLKNTSLLGETTEFSFDRQFGPKMLVRWASSATASQEIEGLEWGSELSLTRELSDKSAATLIGGIYGNTTLSTVFQNYRLLARYRRNFLREWLFFEVEPEITWPAEADGSHHQTLAIILRLEVVFKGATRGKGAPR